MTRLADPVWGIYLHIPFCLAKCNYCAFVSQVGNEQLQQEYVAALCREITAAGGDFSAHSVDSLFFGGGTPTVLQTEALALILQTIRQTFSLTPDAEISMEANPGTVTAQSLTSLRQLGFNRLSLGVQSFDDRVLAAAGRIHRAEDAETAVGLARQAGFDNIGLDLMYGLPQQTEVSWQSTLEQAIKLNPDHLSAYGLKLEDGTPLAVAVENGREILPSEADEETMYDMLNDFLPAAGFERYEIANYAKPGRQCRHNLKYWRSLPFRGFGLAAHSFNGTQRFANTDNLTEYLQRIAAGQSVVLPAEETDEATLIAEYTFTALRLVEGLRYDDFRQRFERDFRQLYAAALQRLLQQKLIVQTDQAVFLSPRGMKFGNQVFAKFLP
jgi:oxygen-independent coproporphyrinogen-3 oxidase